MTSNFKKTILSLSIAIIFVFFIGYGIETFYESPDYNSKCNPDKMINKNIKDESSCLKLDGTWKMEPVPKYTNQTGYCDFYSKCDSEWDLIKEKYNENVFIITFIIGIVGLIIGSYFIKIESVGSGIMGGGTLTIIYGTLRYWSELNDFMRFIILGIVLIILIWIGYKKLKS